MGKKGEKRTSVARDESDAVVQLLEPLGEVRSKGMFGGYGVFHDGTMFALVNSSGELFLRVSDATRARYDAVDAPSHGRMPYRGVPDDVRADPDALRLWAAEASGVAIAAKK